MKLQLKSVRIRLLVQMLSECQPFLKSSLQLTLASCITNFAAGFQEELNHEEVVEVTERVKGDFKGLLKAILAEL